MVMRICWGNALNCHNNNNVTMQKKEKKKKKLLLKVDLISI